MAHDETAGRDPQTDETDETGGTSVSGVATGTAPEAFPRDDWDLVRTCVFRPYGKGTRPVFSLRLWDTGSRLARGTTVLAYELREGGEVIFAGAVFSGSPLHADDSDATVRALMGFLTLQPGWTDGEYFADYTARQRQFCAEHAAPLAMEVARRFGDAS